MDIIEAIKIGNTHGVVTIPYAFCSSSGASQIKELNGSNIVVETGAVILVGFNNTNTAEKPKFKLKDTDDTTARPTFFPSGVTDLKKNYLYLFRYNGASWVMLGSNGGGGSIQKLYPDTNTRYLITSTVTADGLNSYNPSSGDLYISSVRLSGEYGQNLSTDGEIVASSFKASSDVRLKKNLVEFSPSSSILDLPVYTFDFIDGPDNQIGCIAQDLQKICPELVSENDFGYLNIAENKLIYLLLHEVKTLKNQVSELSSKLIENT